MKIARRLYIALFGVFLLALTASGVSAQEVDINDIIGYLGVTNESPTILWDILIIICFFLGFITLLMQSDKQLLPTILMAITLLFLVIVKLTLRAELAGRPFFLQPGISGDNVDLDGLVVLLMLVGIFIFPWTVAAMTKNGRSRPPALLGGLLGALLCFGVMFVELGAFRANSAFLLHYLF